MVFRHQSAQKLTGRLFVPVGESLVKLLDERQQLLAFATRLCGPPDQLVLGGLVVGTDQEFFIELFPWPQTGVAEGDVGVAVVLVLYPQS